MKSLMSLLAVLAAVVGVRAADAPGLVNGHPPDIRTLKPGDTAPDFELLGTDGKPVGMKMAIGHRFEVLAMIKQAAALHEAQGDPVRLVYSDELRDTAVIEAAAQGLTLEQFEQQMAEQMKATSTPRMISPAEPYRAPAARSGGIVSIITAMPRWATVMPQAPRGSPAARRSALVRLHCGGMPACTMAISARRKASSAVTSVDSMT